MLVQASRPLSYADAYPVCDIRDMEVTMSLKFCLYPTDGRMQGDVICTAHVETSDNDASIGIMAFKGWPFPGLSNTLMKALPEHGPQEEESFCADYAMTFGPVEHIRPLVSVTVTPMGDSTAGAEVGFALMMGESWQRGCETILRLMFKVLTRSADA